jgi:hypothetical protein
MQKVNSMLVALVACTALAMVGCDSDDGGSSSNSATDVAASGDTPTNGDGGSVGADGGTSGSDSAVSDSDVSDDGGPAPGPDVAQDPCAGWECGTASDGTNCGTCPGGTTCSVDHKCEAPKNEMGEFCGVTADCTPDIPNPQNPAEMIENPAYPDCMHDQCKSKFCLNAGAPGAYVFTYPVCSRPCEVYLDVKNNKNGSQGADGVEDTDAPLSDCDAAFDGPAGTEYTCVNFAPPGGSSLAYCLPGTNFEECGADSDCPDGEGCMLTGIGGSPNSRCFTTKVEGDWGQIADLGEDCNSNPFEGDVSWCDSGICFGIGCVEWCNDNTDCDTTVGDDNQGCDQATGTCKDWDSKDCTTDLDCSAFTCGEPREIFGNVPEYTPTLCWPYTCDIDNDCPPGNYCRYYWNGEPHPDAGWDNLCLAEFDGGAGLGEACDSDPDDNIPGDTCANEDLCVGGFCSALCDVNADCNMDLDQKCTVIEFSGDYDDDGETDFILPLEWCRTYPDMTDTMCWSEAACGDTETCTMYEIEKDGADGSMFTMEGFCSAASTDKGNYGNTCGVPGAEFDSCQSGWCMGADSDTGQAGYCTQVCESHTECDEVTVGGTTYKGRCQALLLGWGGDLTNPNTNNYVSLCLVTGAESSMTDCSADYASCPAGEACLPQVINYGPDYDSKTDYVCMNMANQDESLPTGTLGESCNPNLEDADGYGINQCADGYCLDDTSVDSGYCTNLCDPANDTCAADGLPGMSCQEIITQPRSGAYESNAGGFWMCQKDQDCTPCTQSGSCPGDRVCANLAVAGLAEDYRCIAACETADDCSGGTACSSGIDGYGQSVNGCFDQGPDGPVNFCAQ